KHTAQKTLSAVLIMLIVFSASGWILLYPKPVQALVPDTIGGPLAAIRLAWDKTADTRQFIIEKYHAAGTWITTELGLSKKATDMLTQAKNIASELAMRQVLAMLTNQIITFIQGGGEPQFVSDWQGFLLDAADKAGGLFVDKYLGAGYLCEPFDIDIKVALLDIPTFEERVDCTISDMVDNIDDFYNDFSKGGWKGWIELTKPQNHFYGAYLIAQKEKIKKADEAREAALNDAEAGGGFLSIKACIKGHVEDYDGNIFNECDNKESCKNIEESDLGEDFFVCDQKTVITPGTVLSDITSKAVNQPIKMLEDSISGMASEMGILGPYIIAIGSALTNQVIKEGLAYVKTIGPTLENPNIPTPPGIPTPDVDQTPALVTQDQGQATALLEQQKLLKENLETQLLSQQQSNLSTMQSIATTQSSILTTLKNLFIAGCSISSWASSQVNNSIIQITASGIGIISIKQIITPGFGDEGNIITYETQEIIPQINSQITALKNDIAETNKWIADTGSAIASVNGYIQAINEYLNLYNTTLQPPTEAEQAALDQKKQFMNIAKNLAISNSQTAAKSSAENLTDLNIDTQETDIIVIQETYNLLQARGFSTTYPQDSTLYAQQQSLQTTLSQVQSSLSNCFNQE
ncbi:hypothetical protein KKH35_03560, partial [Patescibacteria group bacterium]|nr:hypothetical protein [Patescibacteria group bacterium]